MEHKSAKAVSMNVKNRSHVRQELTPIIITLPHILLPQAVRRLAHHIVDLFVDASRHGKFGGGRVGGGQVFRFLLFWPHNASEPDGLACLGVDGLEPVIVGTCHATYVPRDTPLHVRVQLGGCEAFEILQAAVDFVVFEGAYAYGYESGGVVVVCWDDFYRHFGISSRRMVLCDDVESLD
jgi:hypothetical protein